MNFKKIVLKTSLVLLILALPLQALSATSLGSFSNSNDPIAINDNSAATPYPSPISVSNITGTVGMVRVTLNGISHAWPSDTGMLLVGPQGQKAVLMYGTGGGTPLVNADLVFDDTGSVLTNAPIVSGTYRPTNLNVNSSFPAPAPTGPYDATLAVFNGNDPNGEWHLFVRDDVSEDSGVISSGWQIEFFQQVGTSINVQPQDKTIASGQSATLSVSAVSDGTVSYQWYQGQSGVTTSPIPGAINNSFTTSPLFGPTSYWVRVTSNSGQTIDSNTALVKTINSIGTFDNTGVIEIVDNSAALPYPSTITVSGVVGTINSVRVSLKDINHNWPVDIGILLVGPQGQKVVLMNGAGEGNALIATNLVFDDNGSALTSAAISSGTYRPTDLNPSDFPSPAPTGPYNSKLAVFNDIDPNGTWSLYIIDVALPDYGSITGGWQIEFLQTVHSLNIVIAGNGKGSVLHQEQATTTNTNHETSVATGAQVTLKPNFEQYSIFAGWSGISNCTTGNCQFTMNSNATATATFTLDSTNSVLVDPIRYGTIDSAYKAETTLNNATIKLWGINFTENLLLDEIKNVTLSGGHNSTYSAQNAGVFTTITGSLKIKSGKLIVDRVILK